jgi:hypothetical protein
MTSELHKPRGRATSFACYFIMQQDREIVWDQIMRTSLYWQPDEYSRVIASDGFCFSCRSPSIISGAPHYGYWCTSCGHPYICVGCERPMLVQPRAFHGMHYLFNCASNLTGHPMACSSGYVLLPRRDRSIQDCELYKFQTKRRWHPSLRVPHDPDIGLLFRDSFHVQDLNWSTVLRNIQ